MKSVTFIPFSMMMYKLFIGFYFCFAMAFKGLTQFDPQSFDQKLLEHEIKALVDSVRLANRLPNLFNDSILYVASTHHAGYLLSKGVLSHEEKESKTFYSPQDRAIYYGAPKSYSVGENIIFTPYNTSVKVKDKIFKTNSYTEIARCLVYGWVNSQGHFRNIIDSEYQITGLSVSVDPKMQRIYACQKFAHVKYAYTFTENPEFFPYTKAGDGTPKMQILKNYPDLEYPFHLRDDKTVECEECKTTWGNYPPMSVRVSNNNFILRVEDADFVKSLIQNKHDGFAIEIVSFDAFACGNPDYELEPSRRNGMKRTSGQMLQPVYRDDLIKGFRKRKKVKNLSFVKYIFTADSVSFFKRFGRYKLVNFNARYFEIKLGKVPKMATWWNHNLVYIHNKQICHVVYLTNYPGELNTELIDVDYFPPVPVNNYDFRLEYFSDTLELFYNSGRSTSSGTELNKLVQRFEQQNLTILQIDIEGFCSVEGDSLKNELLHQKRSKNILTQLKSLTSPSTKYLTSSRVAWENFYQSVKKHPKWKFLDTMTQQEVSSYLSNSKNPKPEDILSKERKVKVIIIAVKELSPKTAEYYIKRDIRSLFYFDSVKREYNCIDQSILQRLYEKAYYLSTVDTLSVAGFLKLEFPSMKGFSHPLQQEMAFYRYHYQRTMADKSQLGKLESKIEYVFDECGKADHLSPEFHYLSACLLVEKIKKSGGKLAPHNPDIQKAFDRLNLLLSSYNLDSVFHVNVAKANLNVIHTLCTYVNPEQVYEYSDIVNSSLIQVIEYYRRTNQLNPQSVLKLAKTLCYFKNIPLAVDLCQEFLYDNEVLKLYLPLSYIHTSYLSHDDELIFENEFHELLQKARLRLKPEEWCRLFYGKNGIPFQVMDNLRLHTEFCNSCPNRVNEVLGE